MILNGLGFHSRTLHMYSDFFERKPVAKLLAKDIEAYHLTDDVLGRMFDALYEADVSALYHAEQLSRIGNGYSGCWVDADYGSVAQKWLLVGS